jgi:hypothetical protein
MTDDRDDNRPIFDPLEKHVQDAAKLFMAAYKKLVEAAKAVQQDAPEAANRHELMYYVTKLGEHYTDGTLGSLTNLLEDYHKRGDELRRLR